MAEARNQIVEAAGHNWEAPRATLTQEDRASVEAMAQATIAGGVHGADTPLALIYGAASMAKSLGLRADLGHVMVFSTRKKAGQGWATENRFYITEAGWQAWMSQFKEYEGSEWRVLSSQERESLLIKQPLALEVKIHRSDWRVPAVGIGYADPSARDQAVEQRDPLAMAMARAYRRAISRAFPIEAGSAARLQAQANAGMTLDDAGNAVRATAQALPGNAADDDWRVFWLQVGEHPTWRNVARAAVHAHVADVLHVTLPLKADGEPTFKGSTVTPQRAWWALGRPLPTDADRRLVALDQMPPEERLFEAAPSTPTLQSIAKAIGEIDHNSENLDALEKLRMVAVHAHESGDHTDSEFADLQALIGEKLDGIWRADGERDTVEAG